MYSKHGTPLLIPDAERKPVLDTGSTFNERETRPLSALSDPFATSKAPASSITFVLIAVSVGLSLAVAFSLREALTRLVGLPTVYSIDQIAQSTAIASLFTAILLFNRLTLWSPRPSHRAVLYGKASAVSLILSSAIVFMAKDAQASRLFAGLLALTLPVSTELMRSAYRAMVKSPSVRRVVLISESPSSAIADQLRSRPHIEVVCEVSHELPAGFLERLVVTEQIDDIVFDVSLVTLHQMTNALTLCEQCGMRTHITLHVPQLPHIRATLSHLGRHPALSFDSLHLHEFEIAVKRLMDVVLGAGLIVVSAPLVVAIGLAIWITSGWPIIFRQERVGLNGRRFVMLKFRSMVHDAEKDKGSLLANNELVGPVFKLSRDPRVTHLGSFLRRSSLDELPQLWNVVVGDMSLIGPRPPVPDETSRYSAGERRRLSMKPGITGLWQVSGRASIKDFRQWMALDLEYIDNWSLAKDVKILFRTIAAVLSGRGAM